MPSTDSSQPSRKAGDALILARIWGGLIALCHPGGLAGAVVPLFLRATYTSSSHAAMTFVSLAHHIIALGTAAMLLIGFKLRRNKKSLP